MSILLFLFACAAKHETVAVTHHDSKPTPVAEPAREPVRESVVAGEAVRPLEASAVADLKAASGVRMGGAVAFTQSDKGVKVSINLTDAAPGAHVLRIRNSGSCTVLDATAGPEKLDDLATVTADADGRAHADLTLDNLNLADGDGALLGRAILVDGGSACGIVTASR